MNNLIISLAAVVLLSPLLYVAWPQIMRFYRFWLWIDAPDMANPYGRRKRGRP